jgi:glycosyltransferase involved in cell wall biosynthesis
VSVVVPTHDRAALVTRAVRSAAAQSVEDVEILVVDDGSRDATAPALDELARADRRIKVLRHDDARGAPAARNTGLDAATGSHVAFLDDDDEWLPAKLERQLDALDTDPALVVVGSHHALVADDGRPVPYRGPTSCSRAQLLWCNFLGGASLGLVRRRSFPGGEVPRFDPALPTCQDWDYWVRCAEHGALGVVPEVLCRYDAREGGVRLTTSSSKRIAGHRGYLAKHRRSMSHHCRAYVEARIDLMAAGSQTGELLLGPRLLLRLPPRVSWILGREIAAARWGASRDDPGRGMRTLHRLIGAAP